MLPLVHGQVAELRNRVSDMIYVMSLETSLKAGAQLIPIRMPPERDALSDISEERWTSDVNRLLQ